jgi:hypothetical protein
VIGGIGAAVALVVAYRRQKIHEQENQRAKRTEQRENTRLFNERFSAASAQLGHEKAAVRLAGAYGLAGLADDWDEQISIDVLCAYIRMPYEPDPKLRTIGRAKGGPAHHPVIGEHTSRGARQR